MPDVHVVPSGGQWACEVDGSERSTHASQQEAIEKGRDLAPALIALTEWGDRWAAPDGPPILYSHTVCGSEVSHEVVCATCGRVHDPAEVQAQPGPGMSAERIELMQKIMASRSGSPRVDAR